MVTSDALELRDGLPDALRVLVEAYPREIWDSHPHFSGMVQFWLERHQMFRKLMVSLRTDAQAVIDRDLDPAAYPARLSRYGGFLVEQLHAHHGIEDQHYFPKLQKLDARIASGFDLLDRDHQAIDGLIAGFADRANAVLRQAGADGPMRDGTGALLGELDRFERLLGRHLLDEEDLVVPVILATEGADMD